MHERIETKDPLLLASSEEGHHHHQYSTRFQEKWEMGHDQQHHSDDDNNGRATSHDDNIEESSDDNNSAVVYEVHYSEEHKRDFYVNPASKTVSWFAPSVSIPANGVETEEELAPAYSPRYQQKESPKDGGRLVMFIALAITAFGLHAWARWGISPEVAIPLQVLKLTPLKQKENFGPIPVPALSENLTETAPAKATTTAQDKVQQSQKLPLVEEEEKTEEVKPEPASPAIVKEEEKPEIVPVVEEKDDPHKKAAAAAKAMVDSLASKGGEECADETLWERNVVLPVELTHSLESSLDDRATAILKRIQAEISDNERNTEVDKNEGNLCKLPFASRLFPDCKEYKGDNE
mmetsp:Transcript_1640/g.2351  ORF Transcript_1640/g.2351 Transcript_1640/m.2351 type:complete len:349 (+) Transcript_1640:239-1285(+)